MEQINDNYSDIKTLILSLLLIAVSFITNMAVHIIENYDIYFKILTLLSLTLVILINLGKFFKTLYESLKMIKEYFDKIRNKQ